MSLQHALLTSIVEKPCSGYDLARRFDKSIGYFWHATHQQIYRELARMEQQGWVSSSEVEGGRAGKKRFDILPAGRAELQRWAAESAAPMRLRDDMLVRLRADAAVGPLGLTRELERRLALHEQELQTYRAIEQRDFNHRPLSREAEIHYLILKAGISFEEGRVQWTREALAILQKNSPATA
ncbi:PadR family transcriptional regulator [Undibacterium oligocarboniphilum]|uniref:PadR family transcriptional regulator n=1 Tax=Undibacterium oligocarboniphilum TaxID=666702 RepID=A0A850QG95_9BURK|nr:PadR family transcriptional regulator [Undibacterium oligocarboniphilum]MBC3871004.1 PadR family transcriptional regulator [Undibacterium oligocarboniphilum]NVO76373.1 PadR family transcriptional regulator [Undibacterium oligocarboniphilum]